MSRSLDTGFIDTLRSLIERVARLETQNNAVRKNDIRLGRMVVSTDPLYNRIGIQNVKTKEQVFIGDPADAIFSFSGTITGGSVSPHHTLPTATVAREIVVSCLNANVGSGNTEFLVHFDDGNISVPITLQANTNLESHGVNIPMGANDNIYVECLSVAGLAPSNVVVHVRFGSGGTKFTETSV